MEDNLRKLTMMTGITSLLLSYEQVATIMSSEVKT